VPYKKTGREVLTESFLELLEGKRFALQDQASKTLCAILAFFNQKAYSPLRLALLKTGTLRMPDQEVLVSIIEHLTNLKPEDYLIMNAETPAMCVDRSIDMLQVRYERCGQRRVSIPPAFNTEPDAMYVLKHGNDDTLHLEKKDVEGPVLLDSDVNQEDFQHYYIENPHSELRGTIRCTEDKSVTTICASYFPDPPFFPKTVSAESKVRVRRASTTSSMVRLTSSPRKSNTSSGPSTTPTGSFGSFVGLSRSSNSGTSSPGGFSVEELKTKLSAVVNKRRNDNPMDEESLDGASAAGAVQRSLPGTGPGIAGGSKDYLENLFREAGGEGEGQEEEEEEPRGEEQGSPTGKVLEVEEKEEDDDDQELLRGLVKEDEEEDHEEKEDAEEDDDEEDAEEEDDEEEDDEEEEDDDDEEEEEPVKATPAKRAASGAGAAAAAKKLKKTVPTAYAAASSSSGGLDALLSIVPPGAKKVTKPAAKVPMKRTPKGKAAVAKKPGNK